VDGGRTWIDARVDPAVGQAWQRFSASWAPSRPGPTELRCRATDANGRTEPSDGARNAIHLCCRDGWRSMSEAVSRGTHHDR